ncbi:hypothetical protein SAMN05216247_101182 [Pseudomonas salomonii]|uniref:Uncharacterized protein n=1 Tax=Pseudomonas salomonii TaxID=191391 RepID=A0A1H3C588_9PSED|nr:hypothetical protein SAMN05216247_101182 [Pseudomonas salomonii]
MKAPESGYHSVAISYSNCRQLAWWLTWPAPSGLPKSNDGQEIYMWSRHHQMIWHSALESSITRC